MRKPKVYIAYGVYICKPTQERGRRIRGYKTEHLARKRVKQENHRLLVKHRDRPPHKVPLCYCVRETVINGEPQ